MTELITCNKCKKEFVFGVQKCPWCDDSITYPNAILNRGNGGGFSKWFDPHADVGYWAWTSRGLAVGYAIWAFTTTSATRGMFDGSALGAVIGAVIGMFLIYVFGELIISAVIYTNNRLRGK